MTDTKAAEEGAEVERVAVPPAADVALPPGVKPTVNYVAAIQIAHVLAASGLFPDSKDPARAAVKVMIGLDLGISPMAAMTGIHHFDKQGKPIFLVESKLLAAVVKGHPDLDYKVIERSDEKVVIEFLRRENGTMTKQEPNMEWTLDRAKREVPSFSKKGDTWGTMPMVMLTWRALAEGIRLHFPDVIAGQPIYIDEEFDFDRESGIQQALSPKAEPLTTDRAEELRGQIRGAYDELREVNPTRMPPAMLDARIRGAEHSHESLEAVLAAIIDLRDSERTVADLKAQIEDALEKPEAKIVMAAVERKGSNAERIDVLRDALESATVDAEASEEADDGDE